MTTTPKDMRLLGKIADRARTFTPEWHKGQMMMGMEQAHGHIPLDLAKLLAAPDIDFSRDVYGIAYHLDRKTGKIGGHFVPRCALPWMPTQKKPRRKSKP